MMNYLMFSKPLLWSIVLFQSLSRLYWTVPKGKTTYTLGKRVFDRFWIYMHISPYFIWKAKYTENLTAKQCIKETNGAFGECVQVSTTMYYERLRIIGKTDLKIALWGNPALQIDKNEESETRHQLLQLQDRYSYFLCIILTDYIIW